MFDELNKYKQKGHFFFKPTDDLKSACNAPNDKGGVYIVYALIKGHIELVYIGRSGKVESNGSFSIRKTGLGGLTDRLVNGKQFGEPRRKSWKEQITANKIDALDIYWYITHSDKYTDDPESLKKKLLQKYFNTYGHLPRWNNKL